MEECSFILSSNIGTRSFLSIMLRMANKTVYYCNFKKFSVTVAREARQDLKTGLCTSDSTRNVVDIVQNDRLRPEHKQLTLKYKERKEETTTRKDEYEGI